MGAWKVWYQPHDKFGRRYHSGTLTIARGQATFEGKKETFTIDRARLIEPKMVGMNTWMHVAYDAGGEPRDAYFLDRKMLGWSGILAETTGSRPSSRKRFAPLSCPSCPCAKVRKYESQQDRQGSGQGPADDPV